MTDLPQPAYGKAFQTMRLSAGIKQLWLAARIGVSQTYISLIERGLTSPNLQMRLRLEKLLKENPQ